MCTCMCIDAYVDVNVFVHAHVYVHAYMYICINVYMCICMHNVHVHDGHCLCNIGPVYIDMQTN